MSTQNLVSNTLASWKDISTILSVILSLVLTASIARAIRRYIMSALGWTHTYGIFYIVSVLVGLLFSLTLLHAGSLHNKYLVYGWPAGPASVLLPDSSNALISSLTTLAQHVGTLLDPQTAGSLVQLKVGLSATFLFGWTTLLFGTWILGPFLTLVFFSIYELLTGAVALVVAGIYSLGKMYRGKARIFFSACAYVRNGFRQ